MKKPIVNEVFTDNGEHSHWNLVDAETGENLWSEDPKEDEEIGFPVRDRGIRIGVIGAGKTSLIEDLVKAVEEKTNEKVVVVNVHSDEIDFLSQKLPIIDNKHLLLKPIEIHHSPIEPKRKGHERPYKFHR